jgi:protein-S-isoprenylcysteine O-methyltransferase Ste14
MGAAVIALQVARSVFEERVLTEAFPEYADYRKRVKRFGIV